MVPLTQFAVDQACQQWSRPQMEIAGLYGESQRGSPGIPPTAIYRRSFITREPRSHTAPPLFCIGQSLMSTIVPGTLSHTLSLIVFIHEPQACFWLCCLFAKVTYACKEYESVCCGYIILKIVGLCCHGMCIELGDYEIFQTRMF